MKLHLRDLLWLSLLLYSLEVFSATSCNATFPGGVAAVANGKITFEDGAQIVGNPSTELTAVNITQSNGSTATCVTANCTASGSGVLGVTSPAFTTTKAKNKLKINNNSSGVMGDTTNEYKEINVEGGATLNVSNSNGTEFFIKELTVKENATVNLIAGTYWIEDFEFKDGSTLNVVDAGPVYIYVKKHADFIGAIINSDGQGSQGDPGKLMMYFYDTAHFKESPSTFSGTIYSEKKVDVGEDTQIYGVVTSKEVKLKKRAKVYFDNSAYTGLGGINWCNQLVATLLAQYQLDETSWSASGDVIDQTGNFSGTMLGSVSNEASGQVCSGAQIANNDASVTQLIQTGIDLDSDVGAVGSIAFWFKSNNNWNENTNRKLMDASLLLTSSVSEKYFYLDKTNQGALKFSFEDDQDADLDLIESPINSRLADVWYHISLTFDFPNDLFQIYVDGNLVASQTINTSGAIKDLNIISFGDKNNTTSIGGTGNSANGSFDEITIHNFVLSQSEIIDLMATTRICAVTIGSINIIAAGTAVNCLPAPVEIEMYDSSGVIIADYAQTVNLSTDVNHGDWSKDASANGALTQNNSDDGNARYDFLATDLGTATLYLRNTHSEITNITVESLGVSAQHSISYQPAGFVFKNDGVVDNIPGQIAAKDSNTSPNASTLSIEALDTANDGTCQALLTGSKNILFALECDTPSNCGSAISNVSNTQIVSNDAGVSLQYSTVSLAFDNASSEASFVLNYNETGRVRLHLYYELLDKDSNKTGELISATSNDFVVSPFGFCITPSSSENNWQCTTPGLGVNCSAFKMAGQSFNLDVLAKRWNSSGNRNLCDAGYATTQNFNNLVNINHQLVAPATGNVGSLTSGSVTLFSGQSLAQSQSFSDMGVYTLSAGGNGYLGTTLTTTGSQNIGRFYPKDFYVQSTTSATYSDTHVGFSYTGQLESSGDGAIHYVLQPSFNYLVRGFNGQTLQNYLSPFASIPSITSSAISTQLGSKGMTLSVTAGFNQGVITGPNASFEFTYTFSGADHFVFNRDSNSFVAPFNNDVSINISAMTESVDGMALANGPVVMTGSGGPIRYGRLNVQNAYGPETAVVSQRWLLEYYDGNAFILNSLDNLTAYNLADIGSVIVTDVGDSSDPLLNTDSSASVPSGAIGNFSGGLLTVDWSPPLNRHFGNYLFPVGVDSWLQYDWSGGGNTDPQGNVTFGQYRGHDKIIYWKEINY